MASYTIVKNTPLFIDLSADFVDQGWSVSGDVASHSGCNSGYIDRLMDLSAATQWSFEYEILSMVSGSINIVVNGISGIVYNTSGKKPAQVFNVTGPSILVRFFGVGVNSLKLLKVFSPSQSVQPLALAFNEKANSFISHFNYDPDIMLKFIKRNFMFKNGVLWESNVNPVRNNFFGVQYKSVIRFYVNGDNIEEIKKFWGIEVNSNEVWSSPNSGDLKIYPNFRKPNGLQSRLKKGNFTNIQGKWYADFLKNMLDPRFGTQLEALMKGADLVGQLLEVTIENTSTTEVRLISVDVIYTKQNYTK